MTDSTVNWRLAQRNCVNLNVETDLCVDGETTGKLIKVYLKLDILKDIYLGWQWFAAGVGFNLNADMALVKVNS